MGIYIFNTGFLMDQLTRDADDPGSSHDFGRDLIPHVVPRYRDDRHFPKPIWSTPQRERAPNAEREARAAKLARALAERLER